MHWQSLLCKSQPRKEKSLQKLILRISKTRYWHCWSFINKIQKQISPYLPQNLMTTCSSLAYITYHWGRRIIWIIYLFSFKKKQAVQYANHKANSKDVKQNYTSWTETHPSQQIMSTSAIFFSHWLLIVGYWKWTTAKVFAQVHFSTAFENLNPSQCSNTAIVKQNRKRPVAYAVHGVSFSDICGHFHLMWAVCDVTIWRHVHVSKPTFWRSLLT